MKLCYLPLTISYTGSVVLFPTETFEYFKLVSVNDRVFRIEPTTIYDALMDNLNRKCQEFQTQWQITSSMLKKLITRT